MLNLGWNVLFHLLLGRHLIYLVEIPFISVFTKSSNVIKLSALEITPMNS